MHFRNVAAALVFAALLAGCPTDGPTEYQPAAVGYVVVVDEADAEELDGTPLGGTHGGFWISDGTDAAQLPDRLLADVTVELEDEDEELFSLDSVGDGYHELVPAKDLLLPVGRRMDLLVRDTSPAGVGKTTLLHQVGTVLATEPLRVSGDVVYVTTTAAPEQFLVTVVDRTTGLVAWTNRPTSIDSGYSALAVAATPDQVAIPRSAFVEGGSYAIGVAGMHRVGAEHYTGLNPSLSSVMIGSMKPVLILADELDDYEF